MLLLDKIGDRSLKMSLSKTNGLDFIILLHTIREKEDFSYCTVHHPHKGP